ncbi:hypothetical protein [Kineococcus rubinsiae]|uniref:hypothetical protein n=1 Tax=Kineococcus rubinsiae TaxID=2609562 RepID=UPI0014316D13|nr:hypothetical protein [Kineococcus rubinsiae]NIZ93500.1 hypothetical protein [Kineococcus rubinsiae]
MLLTLLLWIALRQQRHSGDWPVTLTEVRGQGAAVSGYLATYLLPFLSTAPESLGAWGAYAVFFLVAMIVYIRSDLAMVNPTLYLLGYRLSEASDGSRTVLVISRAPLRAGESVRVTSFLDAYVVKQGS